MQVGVRVTWMLQFVQMPCARRMDLALGLVRESATSRMQVTPVMPVMSGDAGDAGDVG